MVRQRMRKSGTDGSILCMEESKATEEWGDV